MNHIQFDVYTPHTDDDVPIVPPRHDHAVVQEHVPKDDDVSVDYAATDTETQHEPHHETQHEPQHEPHHEPHKDTQHETQHEPHKDTQHETQHENTA